MAMAGMLQHVVVLVAVGLAGSTSVVEFMHTYSQQVSQRDAIAFLDQRGLNASGIVAEAHGAQFVSRVNKNKIVENLKQKLAIKMADSDSERKKLVSALLRTRGEWRKTKKMYMAILASKMTCWTSYKKKEINMIVAIRIIEAKIAANKKLQEQETEKYNKEAAVLNKIIKQFEDQKDAYDWGLKNAVPDCNKMTGFLVCDHGKVSVKAGLNATDALRTRKLLVMAHFDESHDDGSAEYSDDESEEVAAQESGDVVKKLARDSGEDSEGEEAEEAVEEGLASADDEDFLADGALSLLQQPVKDVNGTKVPSALSKTVSKKRWGWFRRFENWLKNLFRRRQAEANARRERNHKAHQRRQKAREQEAKIRAAKKEKGLKEHRAKVEKAIIDMEAMTKSMQSDFDCLWLGDAAKNINNLDLTKATTPCTKAAKKALDKIIAKYKSILKEQDIVKRFYRWVKTKYSDDQKEFMSKFGVAKNQTEQCQTTKETCETFEANFKLQRTNFARKEKKHRQALSRLTYKYDKTMRALKSLASAMFIIFTNNKRSREMYNRRWTLCKKEYETNTKLLKDAQMQWQRHQAEQSKMIRDKMKEFCGLQSTLNSVEDILKLAKTLPCIQGDWKPKDDACSVTCGGGTRVYHRKTIQAAANGGKACGASETSRVCNLRKCPIDCKTGEWVAWSRCYRLARGVGRRHRYRMFAQGRYGGRLCTRPDYIESQRCTPPKPRIRYLRTVGNNNFGRLRAFGSYHWNSFYHHSRQRWYIQSWSDITRMASSKFIKLNRRWRPNACFVRARNWYHNRYHWCNRVYPHSPGQWWLRWLRNWRDWMRHRCHHQARNYYFALRNRCNVRCFNENRAHFVGRAFGKFVMTGFRFKVRKAPRHWMTRRCGSVHDGISMIRQTGMRFPHNNHRYSEIFTVPNWKRCSGSDNSCTCPKGSFLGGMYTGRKNRNRDGWDDISLFRCVMYQGSVDNEAIKCEWDSATPRTLALWRPTMVEVRANPAPFRKKIRYAFAGFRTKGAACGHYDHFMPKRCITEIYWCSLPQWQKT